MDVSTQSSSHANGAAPAPTPTARASEVLWHSVGLLWHCRWLIVGITGLAAVAAVIIALSLPKWYAADARVLRSEGGGSLFGLVDRATGGLGRLLGGGGGDYVRYLAILNSRSMMEDVVEEFDLVEVYEIEDDADTPRDILAAQQLSENVAFDVDLEFDYLTVTALDRDPERAAAMANFMVQRLNAINAELSSQSARETRIFIEQRLNRAEDELDSVRSEIQAFQETNGIVELESQAQAFMSSMAEVRARAAEAEVRYQTLAQQYGADNPQVQAARAAVQAARRQIAGAMSGNDALLPLSMQELPAATRRYAELMQEQLIQAQIIETIYPLYEQSLFQEQSETSAVQVVDAAMPPLQAAKPSKKMIAIGVTLTAFLLVCTFVLLHGWLWRNRGYLANRLHEAGRFATARQNDPRSGAPTVPARKGLHA